jgi:DNA-binding transcriptional regulator YiaG
MEDAQAPDSIEVAQHTFVSQLPVRRCRACGETYVQPDALERFELLVAVKLVQSGENSGEVLRFLRKTLPLRAVDLAELLDVTPETVSRWETGKLPVERRALALLGSLVVDKHEGRTSTLERLRALSKPRPLGKTVRLKLTPAT